MLSFKAPLCVREHAHLTAAAVHCTVRFLANRLGLSLFYYVAPSYTANDFSHLLNITLHAALYTTAPSYALLL